MPEKDKLLRIGRQWVSKADDDLKAARHLLTLDRSCPTEVVCFHAQQCVEKYLKAILVVHGIEFTKTHDIAVLVGLLPDTVRMNLDPVEQERLTDYVTATRYPIGDEPISLAEAQQAVGIASRVREALRHSLVVDS